MIASIIRGLLGSATGAAALILASACGVQAATLVGIFTDPANDPFGAPKFGLYGTFNGVEINSPSLAKCDVGGLACSWENGAVPGEDYTSAFDVTFNDDKSGTWSFTPDPSLTHLPAYMAVKASTNWALYALDGALSGDWSTSGLLTPSGRPAGISHLSFYNSVAPVPLPAAGWLMIAGLGALGAAARRRRAA
jgi:hypothetical protein